MSTGAVIVNGSVECI